MHRLLILLAFIAAAETAHAQDPARGQAIWVAECAACHTVKRGWDVAHFGYADSTIIRRALGHADLIDAQHVLAHIRTLPRSDTMTPKRRPFQPGNVVLANDIEFGVKLFGSDQWPASLTRAQLLAQDPQTIPIALPLPVWSDEVSGYDWLPGSGEVHGKLPPGVLAGVPQNLLNQYDTAPSIALAKRISQALRTNAHNVNIPDAPCTYASAPARYDPQKCADIGKWGATLLYAEMIRAGDFGKAAVCTATPEWWETGHLFHKAQQFRRALPQRDLQIAGWMHVGWMCDRALLKKASYEAGPLAKLALHRHATWLILRTMVERQPGKLDMCLDPFNVAESGAVQWMDNALPFAYRELQLRAALRQLPANRTSCASYIDRAQRELERRMGPLTRARLQPLADATRAAILK